MESTFPGIAYTSRDCSTAASMKLANSGCGSSGRLFSSGMVLDADEPGMIGVFDRLRQHAVRRHAREYQAAVFQPILVVDIDLVAMAMALGNLGRAVDIGDLGALLEARLRRRRAAWCRRDRRPPRAFPARCPSPIRSSGRRPAPRSCRIRSRRPFRCRRDCAPPRCTAICMPKQMPKYGTLRSRANSAAWILPSEPRSPKPPGTRMPWTFSRYGDGSSFSKTSDSIHSSLTLTRLAMPPWYSASISDL